MGENKISFPLFCSAGKLPETSVRARPIAAGVHSGHDLCRHVPCGSHHPPVPAVLPIKEATFQTSFPPLLNSWGLSYQDWREGSVGCGRALAGPVPAAGRWDAASAGAASRTEGLWGGPLVLGGKGQHPLGWWQELASQRPFSRPSAVRLLCL